MTLSFDPIAEARRNWEANGWGAADAMAAATALTRANQIILSRINDVLAPLDLTFSRYEALALLAFSRAGALPLGKMGVRLQVHPASVTNTIDRLEGDGFVLRVKHPTDGRTTLAQLTAAGRAVLAKATHALEAIRFGLADLDPAALTSLDTTIRHLRLTAGDFTP